MSNLLCDDDLLYFRRRLYEQAETIGVESSCFVLDAWEMEITRLFKKYRALLRQCRKFGNRRFEQAAARANFYQQQNPATVLFILANGLESLPLDRNTDIYGQYFLIFK